MAKRMQLTPGERPPDGAVIVDGPSIFATPFSEGQILEDHPSLRAPEAAALAQAHFFSWLLGHSPRLLPTRRQQLLQQLPTLRGKDLACTCPLSSPSCHAEVLLVLANTRPGFCVTENKK